MIRDLQVSRDAAGFPIVTWTEDRNLASPQALGRARVECRIMKEAGTGILLFVTRGTVRHGSFEEGKPWERLRGFSKPTAQELYYTKKQLELRHHIGGKSVGAKLALSDHAHVLLAEFADDTPLHVNCADASPVDIDRLHVALIREFVIGRGDVFEWPADDDRVMTYDPARPGWNNQPKPKLLIEALGWIVALGIIVLLAIAVFWIFNWFRT